MAYRIDASASFDREVKTVAAEQLSRAIAALETQPDGLHEAIHEARKKLKRVRGLYRLVARDRKEFRQTENARLRDAARSLSAVRDATALIETVAYLERHTESPDEIAALQQTLAALTERRDAIAAAETGLADKANAAIEACRIATAAVEAETFPTSPRKVAKALSKAWKNASLKTRHVLEACHTDAHAERFHDLRKAAQLYWMHLSLLRDLWPSAFAAKRSQAKQLVDILGHEHDISLLVELLDDEPGICGSGEVQSHLLGVIIRRQQALRTEALDLADQVFADAPSREAKVIRALWMEAATA
ncbi:CHAD domain-containing protein [Rhizobium sp. RU36D]|uniref:CHAD domain-containing protein n=1 Tax=Rhizobium sp. RU36D TaxID=1907415 RepID=UPI0009D8573F|nr:CHAD domain-containing protein [Rhizobium sp. RU36D]SMC43404.1 CHAD domain-containing protein [Rhizobium sp. RU36D]